MMIGLRVQMACLMLLAFSCCGMCTDSEERDESLEQMLLRNMYSSKVNKARLPYWKMTLLNVCKLVNNFNTQTEETGETGEEDLMVRKQYPTSLDGLNLEAMLTAIQLQKICQSMVFQHSEIAKREEEVVHGRSENGQIRKNPIFMKDM
ncbi:hypothetical protein GDO81_010409 [Engystomops pustulosus]|uniref:Neurotensin/neuromedin N n=1 Tax=Engystomops pustulosus TaxID=76066 RepID=A0AAV7BZQ3_ENGPU|nr:hypothetical protein GDO81_010409 [Engystomops pustulosus]